MIVLSRLLWACKSRELTLNFIQAPDWSTTSKSGDDKENQKCYVYDAAKDHAVWYAQDAAEWIPPGAENFLIKAQPQKVK